MTSRDFRFKQRAWFLTRDKGICHGCSKGCNIYIDHNREKYKDDIIYRFRPRLNQKVNGYFICDEGRLSYHAENEGRLLAAKIDGKESSIDHAVQATKKILGSKTTILISPNCSLEQMIAIKALAAATGAKVSGYSDGYIRVGGGDKWLIQDDKSANRAGLSLLGIDLTKETFIAALNSSDVIISFNNDLFVNDTGNEIHQAIKKLRVIAISTHDNELTKNAAIAIPVASYSESSGNVISTDGILQHFDQAIMKNNPLISMVEIARALGSIDANEIDIMSEMKKVIPSLSMAIPAEGLKLTENEAAHVPA